MTAIEAQEVLVEKDIVFANVAGRELRCDVYRPPAGREKRTAIIYIHGGAFVRGAKENARTARPLASLGYTCVATQYRLAQDAQWPAQIQDIKACIRWTRAHADELDIDGNKIVVAGGSAGGKLALIAAGSPNLPAFDGSGGTDDVGTQVAACVAFYPAPAGARPKPGEAHFLLGPDPSDEAYRSFDPLSYIAQGYPPTILLHGTADHAVPVDVSFRLYEALTAVKTPVELHVIEGMSHIFDFYPEFAEQSAGWIDLFLDRHVVNPRTYPSMDP